MYKKQKRYDGEKDARIAMYRNCYSIMREFKMQKMKFNRFKKYEDMNLWNSFVKKPFYLPLLYVCAKGRMLVDRKGIVLFMDTHMK